MTEKLEIAGNIINIIQRTVGNIDKETIIDNLGSLAEKSLLLTPPENCQLMFEKDDD